jgi:hypothetical protein
MFPVRYELNSYIIFRRNSVFKGLIKPNAIKTWGNGDIMPHILNFGIRWRWPVTFTPRPLYTQGMSSSHTLDRKLNGPQGRFGRGEHKIPTTGTVQPPIVHTAAWLLFWFNYYVKPSTEPMQCDFWSAIRFIITDFVKVKGKIVSVLSQLRAKPWRRMGEWMYRSTFS